MTSITLNGNDYDHIIDVDFVEVNRVSLPEWINDATPDVDTNVWNLKPLRIVYTLRVTDAKKWQLDQDLTGHTMIGLMDSIYDIMAYVWFYSIEVVYERKVNDVKPWRVTIELIYIDPFPILRLSCCSILGIGSFSDEEKFLCAILSDYVFSIRHEPSCMITSVGECEPTPAYDGLCTITSVFTLDIV